MAVITGARLADDSPEENLGHIQYSYCYMTHTGLWKIFIPGEGFIEIIPDQHKATVNPDATLNLELPITTVAWQGYLRNGSFIPLAEFVG